MNTDFVIDIAQQVIFITLKIIAPIMIASFCTGIIMSFVMVIFQIQEFTFTFVPKILAIFASLIIFAPWILNELMSLCHTFLGGFYNFIR